ncbi:MAG: putative Ig domain-containing protein [Opitutus sp.]
MTLTRCYRSVLRLFVYIVIGLSLSPDEVRAASPAPAITSKLTASGQVGVSFNYQITANRNPATFNAVGLTAGLAVSAVTGVVSGTPSTAGTFNVVISAVSNTGTGSATLVLTILPQKPAITSQTSATAQIGVLFQYQITATNNPTSFGASGLPTGLAVNAATGVIAGASSVLGIKTVTLTATNAGGTATATLTITTTVAKPAITSATAVTGKVGQNFSYTITATNNPSSYTALGLPAGLTVNATTGLISGVPTAPGAASVTIGAINAGGTGSALLAITITSAAPVITSGLTASGQTGVNFSYQVTASNQPTTFGATNLPAGLNINTTTGLVSGIPVLPGIADITLSAANGGGTGTAILHLQISAALPYTTDFELSEGYTFGAITGQLGWLATGNVALSALDRFSGASAVRFGATNPAGTLNRTFGPGASPPVVYVDFFARPAAATDVALSTVFDAGNARFGFQRINTNASLYAFNGNGTGGGSWISTAFGLALAADFTAPWVRLTARADFLRKKWDLYADGSMVAADLSFINSSATFLDTFNVRESVTGGTSLDDLFAGTSNPLFADANNNGIDDAWELAHGLLLSADNRDLSPSGSGVSVVQAYVGRTDPNDFYNGSTPTLSIVSGNNQTASPGEFNAFPFRVSVRNATGATVLPNAPVTFSVAQGGGSLAPINTAGANGFSTLSVRTDAAGEVGVYYKQPGLSSVHSTVSVAAGPSIRTFSTTSDDGSDTDHDGLPDAWELQYLADLAQGPLADPGAVGRTLLQSYSAGLSPWPVPTVQAGLRAWFRAGLGAALAANNQVATLVDLSGTGAHLRQASAQIQPRWIAPVPGVQAATISFNGASMLRSTGIDVLQGSADLSVFVVLSPIPVQDSHAVVVGLDGDWMVGPAMEFVGGVASDRYGLVSTNASGGTAGDVSSASLAPGRPQLASFIKAGATMSSHLDGVLQASEIYGGAWVSGIRDLVLGAVQQAAHGFGGEVAEVRIYNRGLSPSERLLVENELKSRYAISGGGWVDTDGDGLSDAEELALGTDLLVPDHPDLQLEVTLPAKSSVTP